jgi:hypothetical protein
MELIHTVKELLDDENSESSAIIIAPKRGNSLELFLERCNGIFQIKYLDPGQNFISKISELEKEESYNANSDHLFFIELIKLRN